MSRYFNEVQETVDQAVQGVSDSVDRLCEIAKLHPHMIRSDCEILSEASDRLNELLAKLEDRNAA